ncbi:MAG: beta-N-acetylhexosaminidase [Chitinophagaceae bacterium]|nr:beta-N-acetylhexosaminidase [Chitinophagaceae bacterium]
MRFLTCFLFAFSASTVTIAQQKQLDLIPYPVEVTQGTGYFIIKNTVTVSSSLPAHEWKNLFPYFKNEMKKQFGIAVKEVAMGQQADISFNMRRMPTSGKPAYQLEVTKKGILINSNFAEPAFHAIQTLFQLLPIDKKVPGQIPVVKIFDHARFEYRGMHLDVSRHFFPVDFVKKYIDYLAYHKLNTFHWHLTDDQGWRIEIKKYPSLTNIGSWRNGTIIGRYPGTGSDNKGYGGYYTQEQIKEVVKYAKDRFIEVIPEIEMPGHGSAAIAAYPWLSCFPEKPTEIPANMISQKSSSEQRNGQVKLVQETWGVFDDVFCAGNDSTFMFLQNVMDEVIGLFPSKYFHIGGDECPKTHWKICPRCQQRKKELGLKDEHELQSYFVQRMEKYLNSKGKTLIGWDEILEGGLAPKAIVMSWRGETGGIEAAKQQHQVIMTPGNPVYFDHSQSENEDSITIGGYNPIEKVYAYEPVPKELTTEEGNYILGAQANLWTEYIENNRKVEYMLFPRMAALSEVVWSSKENRNWESFEKRLMMQFKRYEKWGANYSKAYFDLKATVMPSKDNNAVSWKLESKIKESIIQYRDKEDKDDIGVSDFFDYTAPFNVEKSTTYEAVTKIANKQLGNALLQKFHFNKATGKPITLHIPPSKNYPGDGAFTLVNGIQNQKGLARSKEFLGFSGADCEALINLGSFQEISSVTVHVFQQKGSWIWNPASVEVFSSVDGMYFSSLGSSGDVTATASGNGTVTVNFTNTPTSFIKVIVKNFGDIPEGNPGAGKKAWLFVDEIEVN